MLKHFSQFRANSVEFLIEKKYFLFIIHWLLCVKNKQMSTCIQFGIADVNILFHLRELYMFQNT